MLLVSMLHAYVRGRTCCALMTVTANPCTHGKHVHDQHLGGIALLKPWNGVHLAYMHALPTSYLSHFSSLHWKNLTLMLPFSPQESGTAAAATMTTTATTTSAATTTAAVPATTTTTTTTSATTSATTTTTTTTTTITTATAAAAAKTASTAGDSYPRFAEAVEFIDRENKEGGTITISNVNNVHKASFKVCRRLRTAT